MTLSRNEIFNITKEAILEGLSSHHPTLSREDLARVWPTVDTLMRNRKSYYDFNKVVDQLCDFLAIDRSLDEEARRFINITKTQAIEFRKYLERSIRGIKDRGGDTQRSSRAAPATIRKKMQLLKTLFRDLNMEGLAKSNPFNKHIIPIVAYRKRETEIVPFDKVKNLLNAPGSEEHQILTGYKYNSLCDKYIRDRAILAVLFGGGLRANELMNLRMGDYSLVSDGKENNLILTLRETKKGIEDQQILPDWASQTLLRWIEVRNKKNLMPSSPLFCNVWRGSSSHGDRLSLTNLNIIIKYYAQLIGLPPDKISAHSARATSISKLFDLGLSAADIKMFSRHNSLEMVMTYDKRRIIRERIISKQVQY